MRRREQFDLVAGAHIHAPCNGQLTLVAGASRKLMATSMWVGSSGMEAMNCAVPRSATAFCISEPVLIPTLR